MERTELRPIATIITALLARLRANAAWMRTPALTTTPTEGAHDR